MADPLDRARNLAQELATQRPTSIAQGRVAAGFLSPALQRIMAERERAAARFASAAGPRIGELMEEVTRREVLFAGVRQTTPRGAEDVTKAAFESVTSDLVAGWL